MLANDKSQGGIIGVSCPGGMARLAWDAGLAQPTIPYWLRQGRYPQPETLEALLAVLNLPPEKE